MSELYGVSSGYTLPEDEEKITSSKKSADIIASTVSIAKGDINSPDFANLLEEKRALVQAGEKESVREAAVSEAKQYQTSKVAAGIKAALMESTSPIDNMQFYTDAYQKLEDKREEALAMDSLRQYAETDPQFFAIIQNNRDFLAKDSERMTKDLILANIAADWEDKRDSFFSDLLDLPEAILGKDIELALSADREEMYREFQRNKEEMSSKEFKEWATEKFNNLDDEFFFDNNDTVADFASQMASDDIKAAALASSQDGIFAALSLTGIGIGTAVKAGASKLAAKTALQKNLQSELVAQAGAPNKVADEVVNHLKDVAEKNGLVDNAETAAAYALANKLPWELWDGVPAQVRKKLEANQRALDDLENLPVSTNLSAQDLEEAARALEKQYAANFHKGSVADTKWVYNDKGNLEGVDFQILNESGVPFATKELAEEYAKKKSLDDFTALQDEATGGFYIQKREVLDPNDIAPEFKNYREVGYFKSILFQPDEFIAKNLMSISRAAEKSIGRISESLRGTWQSTIGKLNAKDRGRLGALMEEEKLSENPQWLTPQEFKQRWMQKYEGVPFKDKYLTAYLGARQMEDTAYRLINSAVYERKARSGLGSISLKNKVEDIPDSFNGKVVQFDNVDDKAFIYDVNGQQLFRKGVEGGSDFSDDMIARYKDTHDLIKVDDDLGLAARFEGNSVNYNYMLVPKGQYNAGDLAPMQVNYLPGGRIFYDYGYFVSQTRKSKLPQALGGGTMVRNPISLFGGRTRAEVREFATKLEEIRKIALEASEAFSKKGGNLTKEEVNRRIQKVGLSRFQDYDTFKDFITSRGGSLSDEISFKADRDIPIPNREQGEFLANAKMDADFETFRTRWNSSRGKHRVEDVRGEVSIMDPFESLTSSLNGAARLAAFSSFKEEAVEMFARSYGKYMEVKPGPGVSNIEVLLSDISPAAGKTLGRKTRASIWAHKKQILHTIRHKTPTEQAWASLNDDLADYFIKKGAPGLADKFANMRMDSPVGKIKSYSFNLRLGMFNPGQLLLQASAFLNIAALSPRYALQAATTVIPARIALMAHDPAVTKELAKKVSRDSSLWDDAAGDFVEYVEEFRKLGLNDFGRNISEIDAAAGKSFSSGAFGNFVEASKVFFAEGERVPRLVAYGIARRKWLADKKVNPRGLPATSNSGREYILNETERLTMGTTGADIQIGLRGAAGIPTQFWSYPFRMTTTLFGTRLTGREKAQLLTMYVLTAGAAGVPFGDMILDYSQKKGYTDLTGDEAKLAYNGFIDLAIYKASDGELETDWSDRIGAGTIWEDVFEAYTTDPFLTLIGGPTGQSLGRGFETTVDVLRPIIAARTTDVGQVTEGFFRILGTQITSVNKGYQLMLSLEAQKLLDSQGRVFKDDVSQAEIFTDLLVGIPLQERAATFKRLDDLNYIKEQAKTIADDILNLQSQWYRADNEQEKQVLEQQLKFRYRTAANYGISQDVQRLVTDRYKSRGFSNEVYRTYIKREYMGQQLNPALAQ